VVADAELPMGENLLLSAEFVKDGEAAPFTATGMLSLYIAERKVGEGRISTQPGAFAIAGAALTVGRSRGAVTMNFPGERPWRFTGGTLKFVAVDVSGEPYVDMQRAAAAMLARE